jgi:hypothetical protein
MLAEPAVLPPWPVFALPHRSKVPRKGSKWRSEATTDPGAITAMRARYPGCNWGAALGEAAGVWALDLDGDDGRRSLETLIRQYGNLPRAPAQRTGGGGFQLFFAWPSDRQVRNYQTARQRQAGKLGAHVDVRGEGGFVVVPPSVHPSGSAYRWIDGRSPHELTPPPAPTWLLDLVAPLPRPREKKAIDPKTLRGDRYVRAAFKAAVERVTNAPAGERNNTLNAEAWSIAKFVVAGKLDYAAWFSIFSEAAKGAGLNPIETERTLRSAWSARDG